MNGMGSARNGENGSAGYAFGRRRRPIFRVQDDPVADIFDIGEEEHRRGPDR